MGEADFWHLIFSFKVKQVNWSNPYNNYTSYGSLITSEKKFQASLNGDGRVAYENTRCLVVPVFVSYFHSTAAREPPKLHGW